MNIVMTATLKHKRNNKFIEVEYDFSNVDQGFNFTLEGIVRGQLTINENNIDPTQAMKYNYDKKTNKCKLRITNPYYQKKLYKKVFNFFYNVFIDDNSCSCACHATYNVVSCSQGICACTSHNEWAPPLPVFCC